MVGSGIRDPEKTYSGSRIRGAKKIPDPDPQHWPKQIISAAQPCRAAYGCDTGLYFLHFDSFFNIGVAFATIQSSRMMASEAESREECE
jgi:hypothetical protein